MRVFLAALILCAGIAAHAQTPAEREACKPDALRLCTLGQIAQAAVGDRRGIFQCFTAHRAELSKACDRVLKKHGH